MAFGRITFLFSTKFGRCLQLPLCNASNVLERGEVQKVLGQARYLIRPGFRTEGGSEDEHSLRLAPRVNPTCLTDIELTRQPFPLPPTYPHHPTGVTFLYISHIYPRISQAVHAS